MKKIALICMGLSVLANGIAYVSAEDAKPEKGMGALWRSFFLGKLKERPLLPLNNPRLYDAIGHRKSFEAVEHA